MSKVKPEQFEKSRITSTGGIVAIKATHVKEQLEDPNMYGADLDPDFQRPHVWSKDQQLSFMEWFINFGVHVDSPLPGNTITVNENEDNQLELIDGKQRLKALTDFLKGSVKPFGIPIDQWDLSGAMTFKMLVRFTKMTRKESLNYYLMINSLGVPHTKEELNRVRGLLGK